MATGVICNVTHLLERPDLVNDGKLCELENDENGAVEMTRFFPIQNELCNSMVSFQFAIETFTRLGDPLTCEKTRIHSLWDQVEDQSQTNSCCANAVCGAYEYMGKRDAMEKGWETNGDF